MGAWVRQFARWLGFTPRLWGLHNYVEANRFKMRRLRELLRVTRGARDLADRDRRPRAARQQQPTEIPEGARHAGDVTRYIFDEHRAAQPAASRASTSTTGTRRRAKDTWDSALIAPGGRERSALYVLSRVLRFGPRPLGSFRATRARYARR